MPVNRGIGSGEGAYDPAGGAAEVQGAVDRGHLGARPTQRIDDQVGLIHAARGGERTPCHRVYVLGGLGSDQAGLLDQGLGAQPRSEREQNLVPARLIAGGDVVLPRPRGVSDELLGGGDVLLVKLCVQHFRHRVALNRQKPG